MGEEGEWEKFAAWVDTPPPEAVAAGHPAAAARITASWADTKAAADELGVAG